MYSNEFNVLIKILEGLSTSNPNIGPQVSTNNGQSNASPEARLESSSRNTFVDGIVEGGGN